MSLGCATLHEEVEFVHLVHRNAFVEAQTPPLELMSYAGPVGTKCTTLIFRSLWLLLWVLGLELPLGWEVEIAAAFG